MVMGSSGQVWDELRNHSTEIRALKRRLDAVTAGNTLRADTISGIIPATNAPVNWWYNGNLLGAGVKADLIAGVGVWISGTFVSGRAYYYIGAYATGGGGTSGTVNFYDEGLLVGSALEVDFEPGNCIWISGHMVGARPTFDIGVYPSCVGGPGGGMSGVDWYRDGAWLGFGSAADLQEEPGVWISGTFAGGRATYHIGRRDQTIPTSISGVSFEANGGPLGWGNLLDIDEAAGVWISGTFIAGRANYQVGAYATAPVTSISGVDVKLENGELCFGRAIDFHQGAGVWISGSCSGQEAEITVGAYPTSAAPTSISGVDVLVKDAEVGFAKAVDFHEGAGVWISGTFAAPEATVQIGAYPTTVPTSISGVDFEHDGGPLGWGRVLDIEETASVWISGTFVGGRAAYRFGAYPSSAAPTSISGVDWSVRDAFLGFGRAADFHEGYGVWISGTFAAGEATYEIGVYPPATIPPSISGIDFDVNGGDLGYGGGLDIEARAGVWISGTMAGGRAKYEVGAYPDIDPYISGVDWWVEGRWLAWDNDVELNALSGVWISGAVVGDRPVYTIGAYDTYSPHAMVLTCAGMVSGCYNDVADFPLPVPFNMLARELRIKARTAPSFDTVFRVTADNTSIGEITLPSGAIHAYLDIADVWLTGGANLDLDLRSANWSGMNFAVMVIGWAINGRWAGI